MFLKKNNIQLKTQDKHGIKNRNHNRKINIFVYLHLILLCSEYHKAKRQMTKREKSLLSL